MTINLRGDKIITFLLATILLVVANLVKADSNVNSQQDHSIFQHQVTD